MSNELKALAKEFLEDISADFPNEKFESEGDCCNFWLESTKDITSEQYENLFNDTEKLLEKISNTKDEELLSLSEEFFENYAMLDFYINNKKYQEIKVNLIKEVDKTNKEIEKTDNLFSKFDEYTIKFSEEQFAIIEKFPDDVSAEENEEYAKCSKLHFELLQLRIETTLLLTRVEKFNIRLRRLCMEQMTNNFKKRLLVKLVSNCYNGSNIKELAEEAEVDEETIQKIVDEIKNENV